MRNILVIAGLLALTACGKQSLTLPPPPKNTEVVELKVPVPVLCKAEIDRARVRLDTMEVGTPLEEQNAAFRETIAQLKAYIIKLEAGIIGCGGTINK